MKTTEELRKRIGWRNKHFWEQSSFCHSNLSTASQMFGVVSLSITAILSIYKLGNTFHRSDLLFLSNIYGLSWRAVTSSVSLLSGLSPLKIIHSTSPNLIYSQIPLHILSAPQNLPDNSDPHGAVFILNCNGLLRVKLGGDGKIYSSISSIKAPWPMLYIFFLKRSKCNHEKIK